MRLVEQFPAGTKFKSALAMDPERAQFLAQLPEVEVDDDVDETEGLGLLSPEGYTPEMYLMLDQIDLLKSVVQVLVQAHGGKTRPFRPAPRPKTAEQVLRERTRRERDRKHMSDVLSTLGVEF